MLNKIFVKKEVAQERYNVCKECDKFIKLTAQCKECGCFMKAKVKLKESHCPLAKWTFEQSEG
jgi:hypothetical protein